MGTALSAAGCGSPSNVYRKKAPNKAVETSAVKPSAGETAKAPELVEVCEAVEVALVFLLLLEGEMVDVIVEVSVSVVVAVSDLLSVEVDPELPSTSFPYGGGVSTRL